MSIIHYQAHVSTSLHNIIRRLSIIATSIPEELKHWIHSQLLEIVNSVQLNCCHRIQEGVGLSHWMNFSENNIEHFLKKVFSHGQLRFFESCLCCGKMKVKEKSSRQASVPASLQMHFCGTKNSFEVARHTVVGNETCQLERENFPVTSIPVLLFFIAHLMQHQCGSEDLPWHAHILQYPPKTSGSQIILSHASS